MKKTKILLLLLVCVVSSNAQEKQGRKSSFDLKRKQELRQTAAIVYKPGKEVYYSWDSANVAWLYSDSTRTFYNAMANPTVGIKYYNLGGMGKDTSIYDNQGLLTTKYGFYWNGISWDTSYIQTFTYNNQALTISDQYHYYSSGSIAGGYLTTNTFNGNNQLTSNVFLDWNNGSWVNSYKMNLFYNGNGELNKVVDYEWNSLGSIWEKTDSITNIAFDYWSGDLETSRPSLYMTFEVNGDNYLDSLFYDSQNNQIKDVTYIWQGSAWFYEGMQTDSYIYDNNNNITEHATLYYEDGETTFAYFGYKYEYSDFMPYNVSGVGIQEINSTNNLTVYPNPGNGTFTLNGDFSQSTTIEVFNMAGEKVFSTTAAELNDSKQVPLTNASKGIYFVRLYDAAKVLTEKVVVQ